MGCEFSPPSSLTSSLRLEDELTFTLGLVSSLSSLPSAYLQQLRLPVLPGLSALAPPSLSLSLAQIRLVHITLCPQILALFRLSHSFSTFVQHLLRSALHPSISLARSTLHTLQAYLSLPRSVFRSHDFPSPFSSRLEKENDITDERDGQEDASSATEGEGRESKGMKGTGMCVCW